MNRLTNFAEIQNKIKSVKTNSKKFITNFYPEVAKINVWLQNNQLYNITIGNTVFFLKENKNFSNLFYCSSSIEDLNQSLSQLRSFIDKTHIIIDIIGRETELQSIVNIFKLNRFYLYTTLNRMTRSTDETIIRKTFPSIKKADKSHVEVIFNLLQQYFDPLAEQLPSLDEINNWVISNHLFLIEEKEEILGFVIFDLIGVTSYLRYWFVHPHHRNKKIGSTLLNEFFKKSIGTKRQIFWVIQTNKNAISRYLHYGFKSENLYDYIMTNKNTNYETTSN